MKLKSLRREGLTLPGWSYGTGKLGCRATGRDSRHSRLLQKKEREAGKSTANYDPHAD